MSAVSSLTVLICCAGIGSGMLSLLIPQRRTKRVLSFVLGLFMLVILVNGVKESLGVIRFDDLPEWTDPDSAVADGDNTDAVMNETAALLVKAVDELLRDEGIAADDIRIKLKISASGIISAEHVDIYISEQYRGRQNDIRALLHTHLSKEPNIYVQGE